MSPSLSGSSSVLSPPARADVTSANGLSIASASTRPLTNYELVYFPAVLTQIRFPTFCTFFESLTLPFPHYSQLMILNLQRESRSYHTLLISFSYSSLRLLIYCHLTFPPSLPVNVEELSLLPSCELDTLLPFQKLHC